MPDPTHIPSPQALKAMERYEKAMHAMQSAIAFELQTDANQKDKTTKSLRVGVNSCLVDFTALAQLLIKKGIIHEDEYLESLAEAAEAEVKRYEDRHGHKFA